MGLIVKPNTFSAGSTIVASEHNSNFDTIYDLVNGNISNNNIDSSAAIAATKLNLSTIAQAITFTGNNTFSGTTIADLGTVTTADINGGSIDGVTIGAASAPTVTDLGSVATCDINGGSIDGVTIGAASAPTVTDIDINGGTIDGVTIGAASAPTVTNLGSVTTCDINGGTVNGITSLGMSTGANITEIADEDNMTSNSATKLSTQQSIKAYVDSEVSSAGKSSTIFSFCGNTNNNVAFYVGNSLSATYAQAYMYWMVNDNSYHEILNSKWTKISSINTVTVYYYGWSDDAGREITCQVDIGGATGSAASTNDTTPSWYNFTIDVSGLSDDTVYDVSVQLKNNSGANEAYLSSIIAFGS